jgi:hypothetical protein
MGRVRKRLSPPDEFTKFYDAACKYVSELAGSVKGLMRELER